MMDSFLQELGIPNARGSKSPRRGRNSHNTNNPVTPTQSGSSLQVPTQQIQNNTSAPSLNTPLATQSHGSVPSYQTTLQVHNGQAAYRETSQGNAAGAAKGSGIQRPSQSLENISSQLRRTSQPSMRDGPLPSESQDASQTPNPEDGILHVFEVNLHDRDSGSSAAEWKDVYFKMFYENVKIHKSKKQNRAVWKDKVSLKYNTSKMLRFEFWEKKIGVCAEFTLNRNDIKKNKPFFFKASIKEIREASKPSKFFLFKMQVVLKFECMENIVENNQITPEPAAGKIPEIPWSELTIMGKLGSGGSGTVLLAQWHGAGVAVKQLKGLADNVQPDLTAAVREFNREIESLVSCRHPNIVNFYGICSRPPHVALIFEYVKLGSLAKVIHEDKMFLSLPLKYRIVRDFMKALTFLHSKNIIHRDLKPANILLKSRELDQINAVLCDFGISKQTGISQNTAYLGTPRYMAPELETQNYNKSVDIYSFAVTCWEIFAEKIPFENFHHTYEIMKHTKEGKRLDLTGLPAQIQTLVTRCWAHQPPQRPQAQQVLERLETLVEQADEEDSSSSSSSSLNSSLTLSSPPSLHHSNGGVPLAPQTQGTQSPTSGPIPGGSGGVNGAGGVTCSGGSLSVTGHVQPTATGRNISVQALNVHTEKILSLFSNRELIPWAEFESQLELILVASGVHLQPLQKLLVNGEDQVTKVYFNRLLQWFCPLFPEETVYENDQIPIEGNKLSQIVFMVKQRWFHGFVSAKEAGDRLAGKEVGTFLLRFSESVPGTYALAVNATDGLKHLRILPSESKPVFILLGYECMSLFQMVEYFKTTPLPKTTTYLTTPCPKARSNQNTGQP